MEDVCRMKVDPLSPGPPADQVRRLVDDSHRQKHLLPGAASFFGAGSVWLATIVALVFVPWWARVVLGVVNGLAIGVFFIVGHDACHGILVPYRWMNRLMGRMCLLPALHPFTSWVHNHNGLHHAFTNLREKDPGFPPLSLAEYRALSPFRRWLYRLQRTWYGLGVLYFFEMWLRWEVLPSAEHAPRNPRGFFWDRLLVAAFAATWIGGLAAGAYFQGEPIWAMVLVGFVLPQFVWNWLIGFIILQQHTHPRIAWYSELDGPSYFQMQVRATPHLIFPLPFRFILRHVMEHTAHHADPSVPLYALTEAQAQLDREFRRDIVRVGWTVRTFLQTMRTCHLYDYQAHRWMDYDGSYTTGPLMPSKATPSAGSNDAIPNSTQSASA